MKKLLFLTTLCSFILLRLDAQVPVKKTNNTKLIKANIENPAEYIRQLRFSGKLVENRNLGSYDESDIEKGMNLLLNRLATRQ